MSEYTELKITNDDITNVWELGSYMTQIARLYTFLERKPEIIEKALKNSKSKEGIDVDRFEEDLTNALIYSQYSTRDLITNSRFKGSKGDLNIIHISQNSPLLIVFGIATLALTGAVILSGGKAEIKILGNGVKFKLPALGEGLLKLQEFKVRFKENRGEQTLPPEKEQKLLVAGQTNDLKTEIRALKKARDVDDIDVETANQLTLEITRKERELRDLR